MSLKQRHEEPRNHNNLQPKSNHHQQTKTHEEKTISLVRLNRLSPTLSLCSLKIESPRCGKDDISVSRCKRITKNALVCELGVRKSVLTLVHRLYQEQDLVVKGSQMGPMSEPGPSFLYCLANTTQSAHTVFVLDGSRAHGCGFLRQDCKRGTEHSRYSRGVLRVVVAECRATDSQAKATPTSSWANK